MTNPGYDEGYSQCPRFWGDKPAQLVESAITMLGAAPYKTALDLGCGDGKNAAALSCAGFSVVAMDRSELAIRNAMQFYSSTGVIWLVVDLRSIEGPTESFDLVVATGSLHCLATREEIVAAVNLMQRLTKRGGLNVLSSFNDGPQDMRGHDAGFQPTLISHGSYVELYKSWDLLEATNVLQADVHPHNRIQHQHSITRLLARRI